jgi:hypothetical protein
MYYGKEVIFMTIYEKQKYRNKLEFPYYYCEDLKDCINKNNFIAETRKKLKRKKLEEFKKQTNDETA